MHIGGQTIPSPMDVRGRYLYTRDPVLRTNGQGVAVTLPYATLTWTWDALVQNDFNWWYNDLLDGDPSKRFTSAQLFDEQGILLTLSSLVVFRPTYEYVHGPEYVNVTVQITRIRI